jgi:sortase A
MKFGSRPLLRWTANLLILLGAACVLVFAWSFLDGAYYQYTQRVQFAAEVEGTGVAGGSTGIVKQIALPEARPQPEVGFQLLPHLPKLRARDPLLIGQLDVPRVGLSVMVREGMDAATLRRAVGHVPLTALPGQVGNFVVLAHRDTFFRRLRELEKGDTVQIATTRGRFTYMIESMEVVEPDGIRLTAPPSEAVATLITCFPFDYVGSAPRRFVARARLRK